MARTPSRTKLKTTAHTTAPSIHTAAIRQPDAPPPPSGAAHCTAAVARTVAASTADTRLNAFTLWIVPDLLRPCNRMMALQQQRHAEPEIASGDCRSR